MMVSPPLFGSSHDTVIEVLDTSSTSGAFGASGGSGKIFRLYYANLQNEHYLSKTSCTRFHLMLRTFIENIGSKIDSGKGK